MQISAKIRNDNNSNDITVSTEGNVQQIHIPSRAGGKGSAVNGGELLFLSLATCFCNDIYREAAKRNIQVDALEVNVWGEFGAAGEPATYIHYDTTIRAQHCSEKDLQELIAYTDSVAEIHNTLRKGINIQLTSGTTKVTGHK